MALLNFKSASEDKLRGILGSYNTEEDRARLRFSDSYVEKNYYKVTQIIQGTVVGSEETYTEYKAIQVNPDGTEVENGIVFDSDQTYTSNVNSPLYLPNLKINEELFTGAVELGKAYQVEEIDPEDFSGGLEPVYYIIPKGGGGGGIQYGVIVSRIEGERPLYKIDVYGNKQISPTLSETGSATLDMYIMSNYAELPSGFQLAINPTETGYEPFDLQDQCFGEVISFEGNGVYKFSTYTLPDEGGFYLGEILATAPNIDYGFLRNGSKQVLYFNKYANAWYINPATFGVY